LVRTKDNSQLWGERYDRKFEDILSIEENIAASIVQVLRLKLTEEDKHKISEKPIDNAAAYEFYLRADYEIVRFRKDSLDRVVQDLQNALNIIGANPLLYSAMATAYFQYANIGVEQEDYIEKAKDYAEKALAMDPNSSKAHAALGFIYSMDNLPESIRHIKRALSVNPSEPDALQGLAYTYLLVGKPTAAVPLLERLKKSDPLNPRIYVIQGFSYLDDGQYSLALEPFRKYYQSDPSNPAKEFYYARILAYNKSFDDAFSIIDECAKAEPNNVICSFGLLLKYGLLKDRESAFNIMMPDFQKTCQRDMEWSYNVAQAFALLDEKKEALDWLENAVNRGFINYPFINTYDSFLSNIRGEERFKKLMERVKYEWEHFEE
jgi:non-specific serine/threonine protein kinase